MEKAGSRAPATAGSWPGGSVQRRVLLALAAAVMLAWAALLSGPGVGPAAASTRAAASWHWSRAEPVPGLAALDKGQNICSPNGPAYCASSSVSSISCWGMGSCAAGGFYADRHGHAQAFVVQERKGRWGRAEEVPGTAALNKGGNANVVSVSCARTGVCVAVGTYTGQGGQWFTAAEWGGRWRTAAAVPLPALSGAVISTVWCAPGGLCAAGGGFSSAYGVAQGWVMTETRGRWHPAMDVPGLEALNAGGNAAVTAVSCASAGNCAASGTYTSAPGGFQPVPPFVVNETNGRWGSAQQVPGFEAVDAQLPQTTMSSMACPSAGNCTAVGSYEDEADLCDPDCQVAVVVGEWHGTWGQVKFPWGGAASSLTCPAAGDCVAAGFDVDGRDFLHAELISETNGRWASFPSLGLASGLQLVSSVSCASPGNCVAGGVNGGDSAFVMSEQRGTWDNPVTPKGIPAVYNTTETGEEAAIMAVACPPRIDLCTAGGSQTPAHSSRAQAFIIGPTR